MVGTGAVVEGASDADGAGGVEVTVVAAAWAVVAGIAADVGVAGVAVVSVTNGDDVGGALAAGPASAPSGAHDMAAKQATATAPNTAR